jgi:hypothetical protein
MPLNLVKEFLKYQEPPKNLKELIADYKFDKYDNTVICSECDGEGKCYDWAEKDVYEGFKFCDKKPCPKCKGGGREDVKYVLDKHAVASQKYQTHVDNFNSIAIVLSTIRNKLSDSERKQIGLVGPIPRLKGLKNEVSNTKN